MIEKKKREEPFHLYEYDKQHLNSRLSMVRGIGRRVTRVIRRPSGSVNRVTTGTRRKLVVIRSRSLTQPSTLLVTGDRVDNCRLAGAVRDGGAPVGQLVPDLFINAFEQWAHVR